MTFQPFVPKGEPRPLTKFLHSIELMAIGSREITVPVPELGLSYIVPTHAHIGKLLRQNGMYEEHIVNWITKRFSQGSGGLFVDVGANFGWYSCLFSRIAGNEGTAVLFEPEPENARLLGRNLALNGCHNCKVIQAAAGIRPSTGTLHKAHYGNPGAHTLVDAADSRDRVDVPIVTLDDNVPPGRVALLKMDIEGFELEAVRGASEVLKRTDNIVLEFSPPYLRRGGFDPSELWQMFTGFDVYRFEHGSEPVRIAHEPSQTCDLLIVSSSR